MEVLSKKMVVEEFLELEIPEDASHSYELINGVLVRKNAPSGEHQFVQSRLFTLLAKFTESKNLGIVFSSPTSVILSAYDAPQPDLLFLCKENMSKFDAEWGIKGAPDLIIEIVSPSSFKNDRFDKKKLYEAHGVKEYWIVDPNYKSIEVFILKKNQFQLYSFGVEDEKISSSVLEDFELELSGVFIK